MSNSRAVAGAASTCQNMIAAYNDNRPALLRRLRRWLRSDTNAEDVAQDLYLKLDRLGAIAAVRNPRALLLEAADNLARDYLRVEGRRAELRAQAHALLWESTDEATPERQLIAIDEVRQMLAIIAELPERSREIFVLNRFDDIPQREIARRLGISTTAVEKHMRKVMARLAVADTEAEESPRVPRHG